MNAQIWRSRNRLERSDGARGRLSTGISSLHRIISFQRTPTPSVVRLDRVANDQPARPRAWPYGNDKLCLFADPSFGVPVHTSSTRALSFEPRALKIQPFNPSMRIVSTQQASSNLKNDNPHPFKQKKSQKHSPNAPHLQA